VSIFLFWDPPSSFLRSVLRTPVLVFPLFFLEQVSKRLPQSRYNVIADIVLDTTLHGVMRNRLRPFGFLPSESARERWQRFAFFSMGTTPCPYTSLQYFLIISFAWPPSRPRPLRPCDNAGHTLLRSLTLSAQTCSACSFFAILSLDPSLQKGLAGIALLIVPNPCLRSVLLVFDALHAFLSTFSYSETSVDFFSGRLHVL